MVSLTFTEVPSVVQGAIIRNQFNESERFDFPFSAGVFLQKLVLPEEYLELHPSL